ncbi:MAG: AzlD domain-containing protein [Devosia sp.]
MNTETVLAIVAMAVATYATRIGGMLLGSYLPREGRIRQALDALPVAVLTAVVAPAILSGVAEIIAAIVTGLIALRLPMVVAVLAGIATVAAGRLLGL